MINPLIAEPVQYAGDLAQDNLHVAVGQAGHLGRGLGGSFGFDCLGCFAFFFFRFGFFFFSGFCLFGLVQKDDIVFNLGVFE